MKDNIKQFNIVHNDKENEFVMPQECEMADRTSQEIAKENLEGHYSFVNLLTLAVLMLFACIFFIAVSGSDIVEDNSTSLSFKTFFSGDYTQAIEDTYNNSIPFPDAMKAIEERISLIYGIGNKVTDPIKEISDDTDKDHNSFDQPTNNDDDTDENVITTTTKAADGEVTTTKKNDDKKKTTTTTAIDRPEETETSTTTSTASTTTNNDKPYYTETTTEQIYQPGPTTTTTTTAAPTTTTTTTTTTSPPTETSAETEEGE